ncbi:MAG: hypothetical protein JXQ65_12300 [Candidatus Marinimicrobia bacterium]|nr:hypothetical protein [Candidatus Neomarinimicrobiota bacterium]
MGTAAILLKNAGFEVEGYDQEFSPPMSTYLESTQIPLHRQVSDELLKAFDLIVTGNVVRKDSEDACLIEECGVPFASFPSTLGSLILDDREVVGIAGTHGKTTTTWLATQIYEKFGQDPGYFIGGVLEGRDSGRIGSGKFFIESDEYDSAYFEKVSKFRKYSLDHMILTSLEFDHADIFQNLEEIIAQFSEILPDLKGKIIANDDYPAICKLYNKNITSSDWIFYGKNTSVGPFLVTGSKDRTSFKLLLDREYYFETNLCGYHNILNLSAVILYALSDGYNYNEIKRAILNLEMVKRRQEFRGTYKGAILIDDFAHHPRAVEMTIEAIRQKYPQKHFTVFLEPRSATARSNIFQAEFAQALQKAGNVVIIQPNPTTVKFAGDLDTQRLAAELKNMNIPAKVVAELPELLNEIEHNIGRDNLLLFLSNANCLGLWKSDFIKEIKK